MKEPAPGLSQQASEAGGSPTLGAQGRVGAAPTTTGWVSTIRWPMPGKRDGEVQPDVNQWWNPLKHVTGSNLMDLGQAAVHVRDHGRLRSRMLRAGGEAMGKVCGVPMARLQGKSWAPIPSTGCTLNLGTASTLPSPPVSRAIRISP
jgi:hypothetical protein